MEEVKCPADSAPGERLERSGQQPVGLGDSATVNLLRGLAAQAVLVGHYHALLAGPVSPHAPHATSWATAWLWQLTDVLARHAHDAVMVFFVLSGYLVGGQVLRDIGSGRFHAINYLVRRFSRLYSVIVPGLILTWLCVQFAFRWGQGSGAISANQPWFPLWFDSVHSNSLSTLGCNLLGLQMVACWQYGHNLSLWSLSNEWIYYLFFPSAVLLLTGKAGRWWSAHLAITVGLAGLMASGNTLRDPDRWIIYFNGLLIWCFGASLFASAGQRRVQVSWIAVLAVASLLLYRAPLPIHLRDWAVAGITASAILFSNGIKFGWQPGRAIARWLASFSFSLYFVHLPLWLAVVAFWFDPTIKLSRDAAGLAGFWAACLAANAAAWVFSFLFESRYRQLDIWIRRLAAGASSRRS